MSRQTGGCVEGSAGGDTEAFVPAGASAEGSQAATATRIIAAAAAPKTAKVNTEPLKIKVKVDAEVAFPDGVKISLTFETDVETVLMALLAVELARRCSGSIAGPSST